MITVVQGYGNKKFVFQGVHETICYGPADQPWKADEVRINQVVFIGRGLDRKVRVRLRGTHLNLGGAADAPSTYCACALTRL